MESSQPMERLLCGDVGFGKTEVAMRAAFKAVENGYQVAVLAPTTVLVEQHYRTFRERMAEFPVDIEKLSRFCTAAEQRETVKQRIEKLLGDQYDSYLDNSENELSALEERLTKLREKLKVREDAKKELVALELQRVVNEAQGIGWPRQNQTRAATRAPIERYAAPSFTPAQRVDTRAYRSADPPASFPTPVNSTRLAAVPTKPVAQPRPAEVSPIADRRVGRAQPKIANRPATSGFSQKPATFKRSPVDSATVNLPKDLEKVALGCLNYESKNKCFPANIVDEIGTPLLSWRVAILPFIGQKELYEKFHLDESWDSPHNTQLIAEMPYIYSDNSGGRGLRGKTNLLGIADKGGILEPEAQVTLESILDGTPNTILVVKCQGTDHQHQHFWTKPTDLTIDQLVKMAADYPGKVKLSFADASIGLCPKDISEQDLRRLAHRADGEVIDVLPSTPPSAKLKNADSQ